MSDLISKLNVLVRASLNSVASGAVDSVSEARRIPPERVGKDIDKEIAALHKHIDDALAAEDKMQAQVSDARTQMDALDQRADAALMAGDDDNARAFVQQLQRQRRQTSVLEDALEDHRRATSELIERVNLLESMVSDARRTQADSQVAPSASQAPTVSTDAPGEVLSNLLRDAREQATQEPAGSRTVPIKIHRDSPPTSQSPTVSTTAAAKPTSIPINRPASTPANKPESSDPAIDDDLARRRSRLSKPDGT